MTLKLQPYEIHRTERPPLET